MKQMILVLCGVFFAYGAHADYYVTHHDNCDIAAMRAELDRATADRRAVITVVRCDNAAPRYNTRKIARRNRQVCDMECW